MIIPHIVDQFVWSSIVSEKGAGPKGLRIDRLKPSLLEKRILDLWNNESYKKKAEEISHAMATENDDEALCKMILTPQEDL